MSAADAYLFVCVCGSTAYCTCACFTRRLIKCPNYPINTKTALLAAVEEMMTDAEKRNVKTERTGVGEDGWVFYTDHFEINSATAVEWKSMTEC